MNKTNERWMRMAIEAAARSVSCTNGGPFGAVIVRDNTLVSEAANQVVTQCDPTAHAEIQAIRLACEKIGSHVLSGCEIYASSEPCPMCLGAIYWARLDRVWFGASRVEAANVGFDDALIYDDLDKPFGDRRIETRQILSREAITVLAQWRNNPHRKPY